MDFATSDIDICIRDYLASLKARNFSEKSIKGYASALKRFKEYLCQKGVGHIRDVTYDHLCAYRLYLLENGYADATVDLCLRSVRGWFAWLEQTHRIFLNPAQKLAIPRYCRRLLPVPSEKQVKRLLMQPDVSTDIGIRNRALLEMAYSCGVRLEEICNLSIFDPDVKQGVVRVKGKGNKQRVAPLGKQAVFWLKKYLEDARPGLVRLLDEKGLWISRQTGKKLTLVSIQKMIQGYAKTAGISPPLSIHSLRRACATHMLQNGAHPVQIQMLLGHATLKTLGQYLRLSIVDIKKMHRQTRPGR